MEMKRKDTAPFRRSGAFDREAKDFFIEYFELTGEEFPACDRNRWSSLDDWLTDLKLAVYREQALLEIYGRREERNDTLMNASRAG